MVYRYGLLAPIEEASRVHEQMRLAHAYRNTLTEIERGRRAAERASLSGVAEVAGAEREAAEASAAEARAVEAIRAERAKTRKRKVPEALTGALAAARSVKKAALTALYEQRKVLRKAESGFTDRLNGLAAELQRSARNHSGVFWGTYLLIEAAAQASRKMPLYDGTEPNDPRFTRWTGEGEVGMQIQKGMTAERLVRDRRLRIDPVDERAWYSESRGERRRLSRTTLRLRVGSAGRRRDPIWAAWPMVMHRPLPKGAIIKGATVHLRRIGPRDEWSVTLTVVVPEMTSVRRCGSGVVAIDVGWRQMAGENTDTELRIARWRSENGEAGELRLPSWCIGGLRRAESLRSTRDQNLDLARPWFCSILRDQLDGAPEWFLAATKSIHAWRSSARFAALVLRWEKNRWPGDEAAYEALEAWRYDDHHLWAWESSQRTSSLRHRREVYRIFAADLARRFDTLVLEKFNKSALAKRPPTGADEKAENEVARSNRQLVAVSELCLVATHAFTGRGGTAVQVPCEYTTLTCHACGVVERFDAAGHISHACSACGAGWDQDDNAAANLLTRWRERPSGGETLGTARVGEKASDSTAPGETRWARAKRLRAEKEVRKGTARKADDDAAE